MKGIVDTATEKFKNKKKNTFIEWTPQSSQEIPVQIGPLEELATSYDVLCQEIHEK